MLADVVVDALVGLVGEEPVDLIERRPRAPCRARAPLRGAWSRRTGRAPCRPFAGCAPARRSGPSSSTGASESRRRARRGGLAPRPSVWIFMPRRPASRSVARKRSAPAPSPKRTASARCAFARSRASGVTGRSLSPMRTSQSSHGMKPACASAPTKRMVFAAPLLMSAIDELDPEEHRSALLADVERRDAVDPELGSDERGGARGRRSRASSSRRRCSRSPPGVIPAASMARLAASTPEVARADALRRVVALADAGALEDPFVRRVHHARRAARS